MDTESKYKESTDDFPEGQLQIAFNYKIDDKEVTVFFVETDSNQDWLIKSDNRAVYQGTGELKVKDEILGFDVTIPDLIYTVSLVDGPDSIRVIIQTDSGNVIFDNQRNANGSSPPRDTAVDTVSGAISDGEIKFED